VLIGNREAEKQTMSIKKRKQNVGEENRSNALKSLKSKALSGVGKKKLKNIMHVEK
jgi:hypothetical protein